MKRLEKTLTVVWFIAMLAMTCTIARIYKFREGLR